MRARRTTIPGQPCNVSHMTRDTRRVATPDGRTLRVEVAGDGARVVLAQLGTPNAGLLYEPWVDDAAGRDLTLVTYDRPGYGGSTRLEGRTVADCAEDVRAISRALGFERCAVWGFSGGGPHALACAALLPDLVAAAASFGSLAPPDAPGFLDAMVGANREDVELLRTDRELWERSARSDREQMLGMTAAHLAEAWSAGNAPGDARLLHAPFGAWLHRAIMAAIEPTADGWID